MPLPASNLIPSSRCLPTFRTRRATVASVPALATGRDGPEEGQGPTVVVEPAKSGGGKQKKKKWSKGKQKEKVNNSVLFDQAIYDKHIRL